MQNNFGPRERIQLESIDVLSDTELVMALLGTGTARRSVAHVARSVVRKLVQYQPVTYDGLIAIDGVGPAAASRIMASFGIAARFRHQIPLGQTWRVIPPAEQLCFAQITLLNNRGKELAGFVRTSSSIERLAQTCLSDAKKVSAHTLCVHEASHGQELLVHLQKNAGNMIHIVHRPAHEAIR
jgi:hypothetical protein